MKIIHAADLHIGSAFGDFSEDAKKIRKAELVNSFKRLVDYAHNNEIKNILLSGDVFDKDKVNKADKDYFYQIIELNTDINFYYLKGNHDINSSINKDDLPNLFLFNNEWKYYDINNITIAGIEICNENMNTLYSTLNLSRDHYNIIMLHGDTKKLQLMKFKNKYIDYIALGHIHSFSCEQLDTRGVYVYSGCLEGRGFDELGEKGFVVIDTDSKNCRFIPFAVRRVYEEVVDITGTSTLYEAVLKIEEIMNNIPNNQVARTIVEGKVDYSTIDLEKRLLTDLNSKFMYYEIKNKSTKFVKIEDYEYDVSLKGEIVRTILAKKLDDEQKNAILDDCIKLLNGEDIEL